MRRTLSAAIVLAVVGSPLAYGATSEEFDAPGSTAEQPRYAPGQLSVKLAADLLADKAVPLAFAAANGAELLSATPETGWIWLEITDGMTVSQKAADLQEVPGVLSAIPVLLGEWLAFPADPPNDARWDDQWGMRRVGMPEAWRIAGGGSGSHIIAIVDSGIDRDHPDLGDLQGKNFVPHEDDAAWGDACAGDPDFGHGTKVAGIAAASTDNRIDIAGTAYRAPIASYRIGAADCAFPNIQAAHDAIVYAVNNDAYAINISTGFPAGQYEDWKVAQLRDAVDYAWSQNVPVVAAVGQTSSAEEGKGGLNGFSSWVPQRWEHVITVGGTDEFDRRCEWELGRAPNKQYWGANYGDPGIDVSAPCKRIVSTSTDGTRTGPGTSFAAPFVAGVVFLIKSEHPNWTSAQIKARIQNTADKVGGYDYGYRSFCGGQSRELGCGLLDAHAAVD